MSNLFLKSLTITNFKGIQKLKLDFTQITNIYGANRSGKTSAVPDALSWLLTDKDSQGRTDFDIKNTKIKKLNRGAHMVEGEFIKNGDPLTLTHIFTENWQTPKGTDTPILKGHVNDYKINGVPKSVGEFKAFVTEQIMPEKILKIVTNPLYFCSMPHQDQRLALFDLGGGVTNDEVFERLITPDNKDNFAGLVAILKKGTLVNDYKKMIASQIAQIKDEHKQIPGKIEENIHMMPEEINEAFVKQSISDLELKINTIDDQINDRFSQQTQENEAVNGIKQQISNLKTKQNEIEGLCQSAFNTEANASRSALSNAETTANIVNNKIAAKSNELNDLKQRLGVYETQKENLIAEWNEANESEIKFIEGQFDCPACKRPLPQDDVLETIKKLTNNFNLNKEQRIQQIETRGSGIVANINNTQKQIDDVTNEISVFTIEKQIADTALAAERNADKPAITSVMDRIAAHPEYTDNNAKIAELNQALNTRPAFDASELRSQKSMLVMQLDNEKKKLNVTEQITKLINRNEELKARESELSNEIAKLQREEFAIQQFIVAKIDSIEARINSKFKLVKFNFFENLMSGGIKEICEAYVDDVAYNMLNTEAKLNAGLDIINAMCEHYNVSAPIVIDNRESVSEIIPMLTSQVINLFVSPAHKKLTIV